uniref:Uncharacterized protein n=1 Tax=Oryza glumipatula TaxID=40148 RepID=A0A0D9Z9V2_9ORYZ
MANASDLDNNLISCTPMMNWGCHSKEGLSDWCYRQERSSLSMIVGVAMALAAVIDKEEKLCRNQGDLDSDD